MGKRSNERRPPRLQPHKRRILKMVGQSPGPKPTAPPPRAVERSAALERAIAIAGSQRKLAADAGVHVNTIGKALHGRGRMTHNVALAIEHATEGKVRAEELPLFEGVERAPLPHRRPTTKQRKRRASACDKIAEEAAE